MSHQLISVLRSLDACGAALDWATPYGSDWATALNECPRRDWLLWLAGSLCYLDHLPRTLIVLCACTYARTALKYVPDGEERPLKTIEAAEKWTRGEATDEEVQAARDAAYAAYAAYAVNAAARYAANAACNAANAVRNAAARYVAIAACNAANAAADAAAATSAADAAADAVDADAYAELLSLTKQHLGAALIEGLTKYAETLEKP